MVAAVHRIQKNPSTPQSPIRPPLSPSEKTNNNNNADSISRRPRSKEIASRYLNSSSSPSTNRSQSAHRSRLQFTATAESPRMLPSMTTTTTTTTTRSLCVSFQGESFSFQTSKPKPISQNPVKRPRSRQNPLSKSLDCSSEKKAPILAAVRVFRHSLSFEDKVKRASFDGNDLYLASDSDSSISGSQEGSHNGDGYNGNNSLKGRAPARGISVPARFWPENSSPVKKSESMDAQLGNVMASPLKGQLGNVSSILSFAGEARRVKKGESRIEEAHMMRLLYNRYLQWRYANARAEFSLSAQMVNAEKNLYNAWLATSELRDSVRNKRIKIQFLLQNLKLTSILKGQMAYIEECSLMDEEHNSHLTGLTEALKASTLRLPVVSGARVDIQEVKYAVNSTLDVMQALGTSVWSLLSKVEGTSAMVSELARAAAHERALLEQAKDLLSTAAAMHVKHCSLQGQILQLNCNRT